MLVLTRQRDDSIMIGDDIEVTIVDIRGDKVRVGIDAPKRIAVHRKEVWEEIKEQNLAAAKVKPEDIANIPPGPPPPPPPVEDPDKTFPRLAQADRDPFLLAAIEEARQGLSEGGLPIGSVLVRNGQIIGRGHNRRVQRGDPMAHAEIECLTNAGRKRAYSLCSGAAVQFGVPKVIVGESVNFPGAPKFMKSMGIEVIDLHDAECTDMMAQFIKDHPELWNEDIGK
jgi:cytosine/creatinine deaminase